MTGRAASVVSAGVLVVGLVAPHAFAQTAGPSSSPSPTPAPTPTVAPPTVEGEVTGALTTGSTLVVTMDATMPGGWEALHLVEVAVRAGDRELERISYDIEDVQLTVGEQRIVVGTGGVATGSHLRVSGSDVIVTTGGGNLSFEVTADVVQAIPEGAAFELSVTDDRGSRTAVTRSIEEPPDEGLTWETVVAFVAAALFVGALLGNLFGSKRRPPVRPSIYATVQRRLDQERSGSGTGPT